MQGKRITPKPGKVYRNKGGGEFLCLESFDGSAVMQNTASRWTFETHGITQYEDGTLEWDYSTRGHFERWLKRCRLCETHFDFSTLIINKCGGEWALGLRGGTIRNISDEDRVYFCPECAKQKIRLLWMHWKCILTHWKITIKLQRINRLQKNFWNSCLSSLSRSVRKKYGGSLSMFWLAAGWQDNRFWRFLPMENQRQKN